jgi:hypothetical protein
MSYNSEGVFHFENIPELIARSIFYFFFRNKSPGMEMKSLILMPKFPAFLFRFHRWINTHILLLRVQYIKVNE